MVYFMAQNPVIVDLNVFLSVKFRQEGCARRVTGPFPIIKQAFTSDHDRAIGLIYSGATNVPEQPQNSSIFLVATLNA